MQETIVADIPVAPEMVAREYPVTAHLPGRMYSASEVKSLLGISRITKSSSAQIRAAGFVRVGNEYKLKGRQTVGCRIKDRKSYG